MPRSRNLRGFICYLPDKTAQRVESDAEEQDRSVSYVIRQLVAEAYAHRDRKKMKPVPDEPRLATRIAKGTRR